MEAEVVKKKGREEGIKAKGRSLSFYTKKTKSKESAARDGETTDGHPETARPSTLESPAKRRLAGLGNLVKRNKSEDELARSKKKKELFLADDASDSASASTEAAVSPRGKSLLSRSQKLKGALGLASPQRPDEITPRAKGPFDAFDRKLLSYLITFLTGDDLLSARRVSKGWLRIIDQHGQLMWKSACVNLWISQLATFTALEPEYLRSAYPIKATPRAVRAYVESILNSSTSDDWRRLYFLCSRGISLDTSTSSFPFSCNSKTTPRAFSPLQLILRGDLHSFELVKQDESLSSLGNEHFLDGEPSPTNQAKILWRVKILPGFTWQLLALPSASIKPKHFLVHAASLTPGPEPGGQGLSRFLAEVMASTQNSVVIMPSFVRLLSIAYAVPDLLPVPLSLENAPCFLPDGTLVFFHRSEEQRRTLIHTLTDGKSPQDLLKEGVSNDTRIPPADAWYRTILSFAAHGDCVHRSWTSIPKDGTRPEWVTQETVRLESFPQARRRLWVP